MHCTLYASPVVNRQVTYFECVCVCDSHNQLTALPFEVWTLKNLLSLSVQQNLLEILPEELGELENLMELVRTNRGSTELLMWC